MKSKRKCLKITSGARLHIQVIDPTGISGFKLGGIGFALKNPSIEVIITKEAEVKDRGFILNSKYINEIFNEKLSSKQLDGIRIFIKSEIPSHVGLGSGTICRTLVRKAIQEYLGINNDIYNLSSLTGVGQFTTLSGGLVIASGIPRDTYVPDDDLSGDNSNRIAPNLVTSLKFPSSWQAILCIPTNKHLHEIYGVNEMEFYKNLLPPRKSELHALSFEILSKLIPSVINHDFMKFAEAMKNISSLGWKKAERELFKDFWDKTSKALYRVGAKFVATTSSGPTTYTIINVRESNIKKIKKQLEVALGNECEIIISEINNLGFAIQNI